MASFTWSGTLGARTDLSSGYYMNQQTGNSITQPIATGQWNLLWVTAQTPWGILVFGKRPAPFGMGLGSDGERTVCSESLAIVAPYGPLRIGWYAYPWRQGVFLDHYRNINFGVSDFRSPRQRSAGSSTTLPAPGTRSFGTPATYDCNCRRSARLRPTPTVLWMRV